MNWTIACGSVITTTSLKCSKFSSFARISCTYIISQLQKPVKFQKKSAEGERDWRSRYPKRCGSTRRPSSSALSVRQFLCALSAVGIAAAVYLGLRGPVGQEAASWACILAASPVAVAGFFSYNGPDPGAIPLDFPQVGSPLRREACVPRREFLLPGPGAEGDRDFD